MPVLTGAGTTTYLLWPRGAHCKLFELCQHHQSLIHREMWKAPPHNFNLRIISNQGWLAIIENTFSTLFFTFSEQQVRQKKIPNLFWNNLSAWYIYIFVALRFHAQPFSVSDLPVKLLENDSVVIFRITSAPFCVSFSHHVQQAHRYLSWAPITN